MQTRELIKLIDTALIDIWENNIKSDYECGWLLKEDTLKNALYFHLRNKLGAVFDYNNIRIFTEFTDCEFKGTGKRVDIVIARVNMKAPSRYWGDDVTETLAVIELKYKTGFAPNRIIYDDFDKLKNYAKGIGIDAKLYMATIWEYEDDLVPWLTKPESWAKGRLTELNASYKNDGSGEIQFYTYKH
ncbi:MAG: hypothetical protein IKJ87_01505 [Ruminococcus sp.]|nr:hypothetical protein [Ruminococcus sp.]